VVGEFGIARDITARKQAEEALRKVHRALKALSECNEVLMRVSEESDLLCSICRIVVETGGYRFAWVGFAEQDKAKTVCPVAQAGHEEWYLSAVKITWADNKFGLGPTGTAIRTGKPSIIRNIQTDPRYAPWRAEALKRGYASSIALPLIINTQPLGALNIYAAEPDAFDMEEVKLLTNLANDLSYGIATLRARAERSRAEEALRKSEEMLLQAQKMESIGRLAGGIAHDLNNFLTAIRGYTDLTLMELPKDTPGRENLKQIRESCDRATTLTRQLLLFSRREPVELKSVNLNTVISDLLNMLNRLIGEQFSISAHLAQDLLTINADTGHIEQVIMNLVVNARDAMPKGGEIDIKTNNVCIDEKYIKTHPTARPGEFVCLSIKDTGTGMDAETMTHIFEPFFTTKEAQAGTGLGLAVVYGIVTQHGGWVDVDSSPGRGSTFRVYLPAISKKRKAGK